jgi:hypothetical protein
LVVGIGEDWEVAVRKRVDLTFDKSEKAAIVEILGECWISSLVHFSTRNLLHAPYYLPASFHTITGMGIR